jgi:hypothetical protein
LLQDFCNERQDLCDYVPNIGSGCVLTQRVSHQQRTVAVEEINFGLNTGITSFCGSVRRWLDSAPYGSIAPP